MPKRLEHGRREELLDGVMRAISPRGFSRVTVSELARELHCSVASLYKIAPSKDSLVVLAIARWGELNLAACEAGARSGSGPSDRARRYFRAGIHAIRPLSPALRRDVERFEPVRRAYRDVADRFVARFTELLQQAADAGEVRAMNARLIAGMLTYMAAALRDADLLEAAGVSADEAMEEIDSIIWDGVRDHSQPASAPSTDLNEEGTLRPGVRPAAQGAPRGLL